MSAPRPEAFTVGHSTRSEQELAELLRGAGIELLVDVRTVPRSRRVPHMAREELERWLPAAGIAYRHAPSLGGLRRPRPDSPNTGWENDSFRGYADHMATPEFAAGLEQLMAQARERPTTVMCAEAVWWRCHRRLIADALTVRGWRVWHLGLGPEPSEHALTPFAVPGEGGALTYPAAQGTLGL